MSSTRTVARNTFWMALEVGLSIIASILTAVIVARYYGPERLGYYSYLILLTQVAGMIGTVGLGGTCRKYMAEFLGQQNPAVAYAVFRHTYRLQAWLVVIITAVGLLAAWTQARADHRVVALVLVLTIGPRILGFIPSMANMAAENNAANVPGSLAGGLIQVVGMALSMLLGWDLVGIASSLAVSYAVELAIKTRTVERQFCGVQRVQIPNDLRRKLVLFSGQGLVLMLLNVVVMDRSDVVFLEHLRRDDAQKTLFTVPFNLTEKILLGTSALALSLGNRLFAQYGEDKSRLPLMTGHAGSYMLLTAIPLLLGAAAIAPFAIPAVYGAAYLPAVAVFQVIALLALPKVLLQPGQNLLQAMEKQNFLIGWTALCGVLNVGLDLMLIPSHGALGAAWANGTAQTVAAVGVWVRAQQLCGVRLRAGVLWRMGAAAATMAAVVRLCLPGPTWHWFYGVADAGLGVGVFLLAVRWLQVIEEEDKVRMLAVISLVPGRWQAVLHGLVNWMAPAKGLRSAS